jgi:hypothetical protein
VVVNGNMVISNNGWTICTSSGELYELGTMKFLGQFDNPTRSPLQTLGIQSPSYQRDFNEHLRAWRRFNRNSKNVG